MYAVVHLVAVRHMHYCTVPSVRYLLFCAVSGTVR